MTERFPVLHEGRLYEFTAHQARAAHARYVGGDRDPGTAAAERLYQKLRNRQQRSQRR